MSDEPRVSEGTLERELKFALDDMDRLRDRLRELEAELRDPSSLEDNWLLDNDGRLEASGCILRLRRNGQGATLTYKGPATYEGPMKVRREHESAIEQLEEVLRLFENLGFRPVRRYQKLREQWQLGGVVIALDHTPIGDYVEFEGEGAPTVARRCGFKIEEAERRNYLRLYDDHLEDNPEAPRDMVFP